VILLGDLEPLRPLHVELDAIQDRLWFIHGNHDTASQTAFEKVFDGELADRNNLLPDLQMIESMPGVCRFNPYVARPR